MSEDYEITLKPTSVTSSLGTFAINERYQASKAEVHKSLAENKPFPHFYFEDFLSDSLGVSLLAQELKAIKTWSRKANDLYSLQQTQDLNFFDWEKYPNLCLFRRFLKKQLKDYLKEVTNLDLNDHIACTGSRYFQTDTLLPHDDSLDERAIAFIFYLSEDFTPEDGGELIVYDADLNTNRPTAEAKRFSPKQNSLFIFPVQTNTWHSVAEVLTDKVRLTLNGWFHVTGKKSAADPAPEAPLIKTSPELNVTLNDIRTWINPTYVNVGAHKAIKKEFSLRSQLTLDNFFNEDYYFEVLKELEASSFKVLGTIDRRNIERLDEKEIPKDGALRKMLDLFRSEATALFLTQWTGLKLYKVEDMDDPRPKKPRIEERVNDDVKILSSLSRVKHRYYSLIDNQMAADAEHNGYALDLVMFFMKDKVWPADGGGFISYAAENDPDEILRIPPRKNSLAIVFREPGVMQFTKYANCLVQDQEYYVFNLTYFGINYEADSELESNAAEDEDSFDDEELEDDETEEPGPSK
ncbi:unnamed protein product [Bursaphelenchus xylophilus]|uniref:uS12 prolyl 3-hydroxylase n=1 Tax=Bursaphelenchus xylophilus TaxID=6326 RepID=A0A1I7SWM0_BURXY|nr:unnamed protein product [Bursaphelenchus xylophilus]CAG9099651.1 unnamed protein product [Bursaphelenchus xylophilus]